MEYHSSLQREKLQLAREELRIDLMCPFQGRTIRFGRKGSCWNVVGLD